MKGFGGVTDGGGGRLHRHHQQREHHRLHHRRGDGVSVGVGMGIGSRVNARGGVRERNREGEEEEEERPEGRGQEKTHAGVKTTALISGGGLNAATDTVARAFGRGGELAETLTPKQKRQQQQQLSASMPRRTADAANSGEIRADREPARATGNSSDYMFSGVRSKPGYADLISGEGGCAVGSGHGGGAESACLREEGNYSDKHCALRFGGGRGRPKISAATLGRGGPKNDARNDPQRTAKSGHSNAGYSSGGKCFSGEGWASGDGGSGGSGGGDSDHRCGGIDSTNINNTPSYGDSFATTMMSAAWGATGTTNGAATASPRRAWGGVGGESGTEGELDFESETRWGLPSAAAAAAAAASRKTTNTASSEEAFLLSNPSQGKKVGSAGLGARGKGDGGTMGVDTWRRGNRRVEAAATGSSLATDTGGRSVGGWLA